MKHLFLLLISIVTVTNSISQESTITNGYTIEPFIGFSTSTFIDGDIPNNAYLNTYTVGILANYYINKTWSIQGGIVKDKMGGSLLGIRVITTEGTLFLTSEVLEQEFITIPIQANWHFGKRKRWNLAFGPTYAVAIGAKLEVGDQINSNFMAGAIDIAYQFPVGPGNLVIRSASLLRFENEESIFSGQRRNMITIGYRYKL